MRVLVACEFSGTVRDAFTRAGHYAVSCDLLPSETPGPHHQGDVRDILDMGYGSRWDLLIAHPPCTHLAVSGARWFKDKGLCGLIDGLELVERCRAILDWLGCPWMLENPVGTLSTYWRKPDFLFDPWQFSGYLNTPRSDWYSKKTCLWVGNGFTLPQPKFDTT